ncbi:MAG: hypothetical protein OEY34_02925 [Cyclobacteriaceae bacterium]|nr:hypothetical protein [Cyclobacteriaceae bacterium]
MVDVNELDKALQNLVKVKNQLAEMDYSNERYDELEEELHDLEDDFQDNYGEYIDEVLHDVHDEFCPDNDVLLPIAYLANKYIITEDGKFDVSYDAGVFVDADDFPGKNTRMVLVPGPIRLILNIDQSTREVLWTA